MDILEELDQFKPLFEGDYSHLKEAKNALKAIELLANPEKLKVRRYKLSKNPPFKITEIIRIDYEC